jgi:hypothetical protein
MKSHLLAALLMLGLSLVGCNGYDRGVREPPQAVPIPCKRQQVYLDVNNDSYIDTLPSAKLVIDDSVVVAQRIPRTNSEYGHFIKVIRLCEGRHQVHVQFGPYTRDTTFISSRKISLSASLTRYDIPELAYEDGLWVATLNRVD